MKTDFSQPRFTGTRFDEHTLPVDVARDLAAYERLIIELAKHLYLQEHSERQRVPKGFEAGFRLDIERIDEGSTKPMLALIMAGALALQGGERDYFERARDLVAECIAAPVTSLPEAFPKELLGYFNQFGRSLRADEALELPLQRGGNPARLTQDKRKQLVLAADQVYEREVSINGYIEEVDFAKSSFRLKTVDNGPAVVIPMPDSFHNTARTYGGRERHQINVLGVGAYDSYERLQKIISIESLEVTKNYAISARFDEISQLENGWFEGDGLIPDADRLSYVSEKLIADYPDKLPIPLIVSKQDGNILLEWKVEGDPSLDIDLTNLQASYHAFGANDEDVERDFNLDAAGWQTLFAFLNDTIKVQQA
ncbi:TPA: hypothetical protein QDZ99_001590 [Stenotrophomonas maltophilia]|nr:hypothetical protein [Stenotrophomonas maltophilia]HDS1156673.1 hypothetical protein [Stenotrophomonas maltophilia]HDS1167351.1 hypothetical protein [Stenotrophomonas maltophilia]HDS1169891.1 hypothetical protein [Stenotrophomonas maltophilia]HDS1175118.1 hypothetical protein [Stenotrophomonas maltophilia]